MIENANWLMKGVLHVGLAWMGCHVCQGVKGQLWVAVAKKDNGDGTGVKTGPLYYPVRREHPGRALLNDAMNADELWDWTMAELEGHKKLWQ